MAYCKTDPELENLAAAAMISVDEALASATVDIESAFSGAGYAVPVDPTVLDAPRDTELAAKLARLCRIKAAAELSSGTSPGRQGQSTQISQDLERCEKWLTALQEGKIFISGLTPAPGAETVGMRVAGDPHFDHKRVERTWDVLQSTLDGEASI